MKTLNRGQGAMEYLMTYSWAILVVMLVGIAMWQMGIFNVGRATSTTYTGFPRIKPQLSLISVTEDGNFSGTFTNGGGGTINVTNVYGDCVFTAPQMTIRVGANFKIIGEQCYVQGAIGDPYNVRMYIQYTVYAAGDTAPHREYGVLRGPIE